MSNVEVTLNLQGVRELRKSPEVVAMLEGHAKAIAARCGEGYSYQTFNSGRQRARATVGTATYEAMKKEMETNTLLKAVGG